MKKVCPQRKGEVLHLNPKPFAAWLRPRVERYGSAPLAKQLGIPERRIYAVLHGHGVHIDTVDKALCRDGTTHLRELYPELYAEDLGQRFAGNKRYQRPEDLAA